jgi:hypothetical protein
MRAALLFIADKPARGAPVAALPAPGSQAS